MKGHAELGTGKEALRQGCYSGSLFARQIGSDGGTHARHIFAIW